ncbi:MAG: RDD family protein [Marinobacter sp.]|nr:RDD family protein [Marinobacter sp.]
MQEMAGASTPPEARLVYAGFWIRVWASIIDSVLVMAIIWPLLSLIYGSDYFLSDQLVQGPWDFLLSWVFPAIAVVTFWIYRSATPGKLAIGARIVDARTGQRPSSRQLVIRYLAYYVSAIPLMLGFIWVAFDPRKQGWHDKLAGTVVVRDRHRTEPVRFSGADGSGSR